MHPWLGGRTRRTYQTVRYGSRAGIRDSGFGIRDSGFGIRDSGFGIRDSGFGIRDSGFGIRESGFGSRESGVGSRESGVGSREARGGIAPSSAGMDSSCRTGRITQARCLLPPAGEGARRADEGAGSTRCSRCALPNFAKGATAAIQYGTQRLRHPAINAAASSQRSAPTPPVSPAHAPTPRISQRNADSRAAVGARGCPRRRAPPHRARRQSGRCALPPPLRIPLPAPRHRDAAARR